MSFDTSDTNLRCRVNIIPRNNCYLSTNDTDLRCKIEIISHNIKQHKLNNNIIKKLKYLKCILKNHK